MSDMRLGIVAEFTDRATRKLQKLYDLQKKLGKGSATGTRGTDRQTRAYERMGNAAKAAFAKGVAGARAAGRAIGTLHRKTVALGKRGLSDVGSGFKKVGRGAVLAGGIATSAFASAGLAAGYLTGTASEFERYQTILETTEGSGAKAEAAMGWVTNFAVKTPYELGEITDSFVKLRSYGLDPTQGLLQSLGDTSAAMGKPLVQAVEAMADAVTGENERLKEFGITAKKAGDQITYSYTNAAGEAATATVRAGDRMAIQMKLMDIFNEKYGGAMERLSATWDGMVANLMDMWVKFQLMIMQSGLFDWMKDKLSGILDTINQMEADGSLKEWATSIGQSIQTTLEAAWQFALGFADAVSTIAGHLSTAAQFVGGWRNLLMILGAMTFAPALVATAVGIMQIARGLAFLGVALAANPIGLAVAGIAALVYVIYANWDAVLPYFTNLWNG
ncbi:MAG: tape measure protein, partial [Pseudomonadota bacterium]